MALNWDELKSQDDKEAPIVFIYGGPKLGKTTLASEFPNPYYLRTSVGERQSAGSPMKSFGVSDTYQDVIYQIKWMLEETHDRETLVVDALDGLETLIRAEACARNGWAEIEEPGFGRGYAVELGIWQEFIREIEKLKRAGYNVVLISHVKVKTVPGVTTDSYPRYMPNLRDDASTALTSASDVIGFIHQRISVKKEELGFKKVAARGESGGEIVIAVKERPGYVAGNRYSIPVPTLPFKEGSGYAELSKYFPAIGEQ